ncbi:MAG: helix-turn-helix domain-containing protein [Victivallaceae bacterium]|nr:helix-turn-helix domain-containing protein [Victivallaceae bacterium]
MIQSLDRAFQILELLNTLECAKNGLGGLEISKTLGLKQPTVHNFLKSLAQLGYIQQDPDTSKFRLAEKVKNIGMNMMQCESLAICAKPHLRALSQLTGETSILILLDNDQRHTVLIEECSKPYRIAVSSTVDQNFYNTATGRILLSNMDTSEYQAFRQRIPIDFKPSFAPKSNLEMVEILKNIQAKGYESIIKDSVTVIGVPLVNKASGLNAAIGIYFHTNGRTQKEIEELAQAMQKTSDRVSAILAIH